MKFKNVLMEYMMSNDIDKNNSGVEFCMKNAESLCRDLEEHSHYSSYFKQIVHKSSYDINSIFDMARLNDYNLNFVMKLMFLTINGEDELQELGLIVNNIRLLYGDDLLYYNTTRDFLSELCYRFSGNNFQVLKFNTQSKLPPSYNALIPYGVYHHILSKDEKSMLFQLLFRNINRCPLLITKFEILDSNNEYSDFCMKVIQFSFDSHNSRLIENLKVVLNQSSCNPTIHKTLNKVKLLFP